jgi:thiol-disulfide isomerase/thioredoxin
MKQSFFAWLIWGLLGLPFTALAIEEGAPAPAYDITLANGSHVTNASEKGRVVLLHFWATWCEPCREEMPVLERFYRQHHAEGLDMIMVSMDDPADFARARETMKQHSMPGVFYRDTQMKGFGRIWRIPVTFLIDRNNVLQKDEWFGDPVLNESVLGKTINPLLIH